jgi:GDP/UDP-N,N'-diacetylbacillosamine 2-epimerase (hydrolysing)
MKRVAIVTATRAEYGLLAPIIDELRHYESDSFRVELIVTGTHLYSDYGMTIDEIKERGTRIDHSGELWKCR